MTQGPPRIFDRAAVRRHLERRPSADNFVLQLALDDLTDRLGAVVRKFEAALIMAPDASALPTIGNTAAGPFAYTRASTLLSSPGAIPINPDAVALPRSDHDLVVSLFDLTIIDDVPGFLAQLRRYMRPDGLLLAVTLGGNTLGELRRAFLLADTEAHGGAFARVAPFVEVRDAGALLQRAGFALPVADVDTHAVRYGHALALMAELKALGAQNPLLDRPARPATRPLIAAAAEHYAQTAADPDGRVRATLELVWLSGWVPHESQQQPLQPGSAAVNLRDVLEKR